MQNVNFDKFYITIPCCEDFYCRVLDSKSLPPIFCNFRFQGQNVLIFYCVDKTNSTAFLKFTDFISCLPPETPRNIALIYSISPYARAEMAGIVNKVY